MLDRLLQRLIRSWYPTPDKRSIAPFLWTVWRRRLTETGRVLVVIFGVAGTVCLTLLGAGYPLYHFAVFLLVLLVLSRLAGMVFKPRVKVDRALPERVACGAPITVRAVLTNTSRLPALDLSVSEQIAHKDANRVRAEERPQAWGVLGSGERAELVYTLTFLRRGAYEVGGAEPATSFPFGLYRVVGRPSGPQRVLVYPRFQPLARIDLPVSRRHQPGGLQLVSSVGESEEFVGCREYRVGDRLRDLDMRAWARVGFPVVREYNQEYLTRIALVVDTYVSGKRVSRRRGSQDLLALEAAISLCASVADALSRLDYVIDIFAAGPDLYHLQAGRSLAYLNSVLDVLACLEPNASNPFEVLGPAILDSISGISTAVAVFLDWDDDRLRFARALHDQGVVLKVIVVRDGPPTLDPRDFNAGGGVTLLTPAQVEAGVDVL